MPTLGEACQILGVGRMTLEKWMLRLGISPAAHGYDFRYKTITPEEVEAIRAARSHLPGAISHSQPRQGALKRPDVQRDRPAPLRPPVGLPTRTVVDAFTTKTEAARWLSRHGVSENTARGWATWAGVSLDPRSVLLFGLSMYDPSEYRQRWRLTRCDDAACVCHELLTDSGEAAAAT